LQRRRPNFGLDYASALGSGSNIDNLKASFSFLITHLLSSSSLHCDGLDEQPNNTTDHITMEAAGQGIMEG
jgi:hypothetical protein